MAKTIFSRARSSTTFYGLSGNYLIPRLQITANKKNHRRTFASSYEIDARNRILRKLLRDSTVESRLDRKIRSTLSLWQRVVKIPM